MKRSNRLPLRAAALLFIGLGASTIALDDGHDHARVSLVSPARLAAATNGGPIVLDGMDPVCHAAYGENTDQYIAKVLKSVYDQSSMPGSSGKIAILGVSSTTTAGGCGSNWTTLLNTKFLTQFATAPTVEFITTSTELNSFFSTGITATPPKMIWIPDDWGRSGTVSSIFTTNAERLADFVNSGGGLFANYNTYGWLTALLPSAVFNNGGCNGGPEATADGIADFGLSNTIVAACWHGYFTGDVGTLKTLVDYPYPSPSDTRKAVSIGGGAVSLPSSFILSVSPENPEAGQDLVITATAQTLAGVPQAGVEVTVTISAGPDAGTTFTAVTDASGIATITVRTAAAGSATYTATATVNGILKTVSTTVTWAPAATTTVPETTTTEPPATTVAPPVTDPAPVETTAPATTAAPATTEMPVVIVPDLSLTGPTTTQHDHSSHNHVTIPKNTEKLPTTGSSTFSSQGLLGSLFLGFGLVLLILAARTRKTFDK